MYFPKGFDWARAMELGALVLEAYAQFRAFEDGTAWALPEGYRLLAELKYSPGPETAAGRKFFGFDIDVKRRLAIRKDGPVDMPLGFIARKRNNTYIIFRGTKTAREWMNNFSVTMKELPLPGWGRAHEGFLQSYAAVAGAIRAGLGGLDGASRIYVAGHSLGAALATLALPDLGADLGGKMAGLYTFGSPRVGDAVFSRVYDAAFGARSFRIVNSSDIVTSVPLPVPIMGFVGDYFSHVSTPVEFGSQNGDPELNHAMKTYLEALEGSRPPEGWWRRVFAGGK